MKIKTIKTAISEKVSFKPIFFQTGSLFLLMFAYGFSVTMIGPLIPIFIQQFELALSQGGLISVFQGIGGVIAILFSGFLADLVKKSELIKVTFIIYSLTLATIAVSSTYIILLGLFFIIGASTKMLDAVLNAYISDIYSNRRGLYLNLLHACFGVGAFAGPIFSSLLYNAGLTWNEIFLTLGIFCIILVMFYFLAFKKAPFEKKEPDSVPPIKVIILITSRKIYIVCFFGLIYSGYSASISVWMPTYMLEHLKTDVLVSGFLVSVFWIGIITGRIIYLFLSNIFIFKHIIFVNSLACGLILISVIFVKNPLILIIFIGLAGFFSGAIIPLSVSKACSWYPQNTGLVSSMIMFFVSLGYAIVPWLIGVIMEISSFQIGMFVSSMLPLIITLLTLFLPSGQNNLSQIAAKK